MGFADFPVEILRALRVKHSEESIIKTSSSSLLMSNSMQPVLYAPFTETSNLSDTTSKETDCGKAKKSESENSLVIQRYIEDEHDDLQVAC